MIIKSKGSDDVDIATITSRKYTDGRTRVYTSVFNASNAEASMSVDINDNGDQYATAPYRAYNSAHTNEIVTIGSLAANPSVIHATGNETKSGNFEITGVTFIGDTDRQISAPAATGFKRMSLWSKNSTGNVTAIIELRALDNGTVALYLRKFDYSGSALGETLIASL